MERRKFVMRIMQFKGKKNLIHMQLQLMRVRRALSQSELAAQMQILGTNIDQPCGVHAAVRGAVRRDAAVDVRRGVRRQLGTDADIGH